MIYKNSNLHDIKNSSLLKLRGGNGWTTGAATSGSGRSEKSK